MAPRLGISVLVIYLMIILVIIISLKVASAFNFHRRIIFAACIFKINLGFLMNSNY